VNVETERKFVLSEPPDDLFLGPGEAMRQGYIAEENDATVRIRITARRATLTVKVGVGLSRTEVEVEVEPDQADALWQHTTGRRIEKTRHRVPVGDGGLVAEVDVYGGSLSGLFTAEVEFQSEQDATAFAAPTWLGREVTGEEAWSNAALARDGRPA
jgi:adenylate cyclase